MSRVGGKQHPVEVQVDRYEEEILGEEVLALKKAACLVERVSVRACRVLRWLVQGGVEKGVETVAIYDGRGRLDKLEEGVDNFVGEPSSFSETVKMVLCNEVRGGVGWGDDSVPKGAG